MENLKKQVVESEAKALKIKIGGRMSHVEYPAGRSEKLIPMVRKEFGDQMVCYADSNGSYDVAEGIKFGRLLEEYKFAFYEEPVPFDWYEETKAVTDAVNIPVAGGEQEASMHAFRWLIANDGLDIVQADMYYFGGFIRSHEGGAHGRRDGQGAHAAHFRRAGLSLHDSFRVGDSKRRAVPRIQRTEPDRYRSNAGRRR